MQIRPSIDELREYTKHEESKKQFLKVVKKQHLRNLRAKPCSGYEVGGFNYLKDLHFELTVEPTEEEALLKRLKKIEKGIYSRDHIDKLIGYVIDDGEYVSKHNLWSKDYDYDKIVAELERCKDKRKNMKPGLLSNLRTLLSNTCTIVTEPNLRRNYIGNFHVHGNGEYCSRYDLKIKGETVIIFEASRLRLKHGRICHIYNGKVIRIGDLEKGIQLYTEEQLEYYTRRAA